MLEPRHAVLDFDFRRPADHDGAPLPLRSSIVPLLYPRCRELLTRCSTNLQPNHHFLAICLPILRLAPASPKAKTGLLRSR